MTNTLELSERKQIEELIGNARRMPPRARMTKGHNLEPLYRPRSDVARGRCSCGVCARCRDNARWERIFREKFADPSYYNGGLIIRRTSPWG